MQDTISHDGLFEFVRIKWGLRHLRLHLSPEAGSLPFLDTQVFLNKRGNIQQPPTFPYVSLSFHPTATHSSARINRQWLGVSELLVREMDDRGLAGAISLPPGVDDVRAWQWAGYKADVRYTYYLDFPFDCRQADGDVRTKINKARKLGYSCERSLRMEDVYACVASTGKRKGLKENVSLHDMELAQSLLGEEHLRGYVCYAPDGEPASASLVIHFPGARSSGWLLGTKTEHLQTGATQLLLATIFADIQADGAVGFDFTGANVRSVASAKSFWGGKLVPYYVVDKVGMRFFLSHIRSWWNYSRSGGKGS